MKTPDNIEIFLTHGSHDLPEEMKPYIRPEFDKRLQINFSDTYTDILAEKFPQSKTSVPLYGRIAGDTNRARTAPDLFRETDFNDIPIFNSPLPEHIKELALKQSYDPYHQEILRKLLKKHGNPRSILLAFDIHDTGNLMLGEDPEDDTTRVQRKDGWHMPPVIISNKDGLTADAQIMDDLEAALITHFKLAKGDVRQNWKFKGGYVTSHYGNPENPQLKEALHETRAVIQVEFDRSLYLDERKQMVVSSAMSWCQEKLHTALCEVADGYTFKAKA